MLRNYSLKKEKKSFSTGIFTLLRFSKMVLLLTLVYTSDISIEVFLDNNASSEYASFSLFCFRKYNVCNTMFKKQLLHKWKKDERLRKHLGNSELKHYQAVREYGQTVTTLLSVYVYFHLCRSMWYC